MFTVGQEIVIKKKNQLIKAKILQCADFQEEMLWWVEYNYNDVRSVNVYTEEDLKKWNISLDYCDCGASKTLQPGHSVWCKFNA